jgi:putative DNA primase/helicase
MGDFAIGTAASIARALDGVRSGNAWRCTCPVHGGHSLCITEGHTGKLLLKCWGSDCSFTDIMNALREMKLIDGLPIGCAPIEADETAELARRIRHAQALYRRSEAAAGTIVETYLRSRGILLLSPVLRFIRWCPHRNSQAYPAIVAPVVNVDCALIGMSATFLRSDGSSKIDLPAREQRQFYGAIKGGAVRLGPLGEPLLVGEGIESVLSAMQLYDHPNGWAALSATGLTTLELPPEIRNIAIAADNDDAGIDAVLVAHRHWSDEGRTVRILTPPDGNNDFNDTLKKTNRA